MTCATCQKATRPSKDQKLFNWMSARGLAFCQAYGERQGRRFMIPLKNAAGMVCGGRWFESNGELI